jgi:ribosomal protein L20A (L18A)
MGAVSRAVRVCDQCYELSDSKRRLDAQKLIEKKQNEDSFSQLYASPTSKHTLNRRNVAISEDSDKNDKSEVFFMQNTPIRGIRTSQITNNAPVSNVPSNPWAYIAKALSEQVQSPCILSFDSS